MQIQAGPRSSSTATLVSRAHAPGRINLIGEHTDYNGGKVLPFTMQLGVECELWVSDQQGPWQQSMFELSSDHEAGIFSVMASELLPAATKLAEGDYGTDLRPLFPAEITGRWCRYGLGVLVWHVFRLQSLQPDAHLPSLMRITLKSNLPVGAGISSSAALCVGLLALLADSAKLPLILEDIARQAMYVEHQFAGTRCGLMDQMAVALCKAHQLLLIDFKDLPIQGKVTTRGVRLHPNFEAYRPVLINTRVKHELGNSPYNERRSSCEEGLLQLCRSTGRDYPSLGYFAADQSFLAEYMADGQQATLAATLLALVFPHEPVKAQRLSHAIAETLRVDRAAEALEAGDLGQLTELINASHESLRLAYEVSCQELDLIRQQALSIAEDLAQTTGFQGRPMLGARMTGGGFGGSTIQLVHKALLEPFCQRMRAVDSVYVKQTGLVPDVMVANFASGLRTEALCHRL